LVVSFLPWFVGYAWFWIKINKLTKATTYTILLVNWLENGIQRFIELALCWKNTFILCGA